MAAWTRLLEMLEAEGDDRPRTRMQQMPPPRPGAGKQPPKTYLPGVHSPDSPIRPKKRMGEGPMPSVMPSAGSSTAMPSPSAGEEEQDEAKSNWQKLDRQRNIQRWGSISGRAHDQQRARLTSPTSIFNRPSERELAAQHDRAQRAMASIPAGSDVTAPAPNPLMAPSRGASPAPTRRSSWALLDPDDDEGF